MQAIHFGAGNIGKGFIASVLVDNGFDVCFVDVDKTNIATIREQNKYYVEVLSLEPKRLEVKNITILDGIDEQQQIIEKMCTADLITTSVGVNNLSIIAPLIIQGLIARFEKFNQPINIIANENAINASNILKQIIIEQLPIDYAAILSHIGFVNSAIDRQAITKDEGGHTITAVEPFWEWVINQKEMVNYPLPKLVGVTYVDDLQPYIEKKLYIANLGHASLAYLGYVVNQSTIIETLSIRTFRQFVQTVMQDSAKYLIVEYGFEHDYLINYIENTLNRFANPHLKDSVLRVAKSPIRKLGADERLVGPLIKLYSRDLPINNLAKVVAMALLFNDADDAEATALQDFIERYGIERAIVQYCQIKDSSVITLITHYYQQFLAIDHKQCIASRIEQIEQILFKQ